jgi:hypothetical protein
MHKSANDSADTYKTLRQQARALMSSYIASSLPQGTTLSDLDEQALLQANQWGGFAWEYIAKKFRRRPRRVELAIWFDGTLCGIACGRVSNRRIVASIHYLQSNPVEHPLNGYIAPISTLFLDTMAILAGCSESSIQNPVPGLIDFYKKLGYVKEQTKGKKIKSLNKILP